ncbi:hypothetical protein AAFN60_02795 [Roseibacillus persicicus]
MKEWLHANPTLEVVSIFNGHQIIAEPATVFIAVYYHEPQSG